MRREPPYLILIADHYPFRKAGGDEIKARSKADFVIVDGFVEELRRAGNYLSWTVNETRKPQAYAAAG